MTKTFFFGKPLQDDAVRLCVLFDPKDGRVVHVHGVAPLPGGGKVTDAELEKRARSRANALGHNDLGLKALYTLPSAVFKGSHFRVNPETSQLEFSPRREFKGFKG